MKPLIILDRDGVINQESPHYIKSPDEWIEIPNSTSAIGLLTKAGYRSVIATNQSGVNRGLFSRHMLDKIHEKMLSLVHAAGGKIDGIYFCPHKPDENCDCRKPKPGLLQQIQHDFNLTPQQMLMVGDSQRDYEATQTFGCEFVLVRTGNGSDLVLPDSVPVFDDLLAFVKSFSAHASA